MFSFLFLSFLFLFLFLFSQKFQKVSSYFAPALVSPTEAAFSLRTNFIIASSTRSNFIIILTRFIFDMFWDSGCFNADKYRVLLRGELASPVG